MEKAITITSVVKKFTKPNETGQCTPFWAVESSFENKLTVWDSKIADKLSERIGQLISCELKESNGFWNIRDVNDASDGTVQADVQQSETKPEPLCSSRENSILAQVFVKCVAYGGNVKTVKEAYDLYQEGLKILA